MSRKHTPSLEQLQEVAEKKLVYVVWMINQTATLSDDNNSVKHNAYIESFVINTRLLLSFMSDKAKREDDIIAADYLESGKPLDIGEYLRDVKERASKLAAHLTTKGLDPKDEYRQWNRTDIRDNINEKVEIFLESVPDDRISRETKSTIRSKKAGKIPPIDAPYFYTKSIGVTGATGSQMK